MIESNVDEGAVDDGSPIDFHGKLAVIELAIGLLVAGIYYVFSQMGVMSGSLWKSVVIVQLCVSAVLFIHYIANRRSRRLWVEGVVSLFAMVPWLMISLVWLFYVSYVMPVMLRSLVIVACFLIIGWHSLKVWLDFSRAVKSESIVGTIYYESGEGFVFRNSLGGYIDKLTSRNPLKGSLLAMIGYASPFAAAFGLSANHIFGESVGPHVLCVILSILGFPMSIWILGNAYVRSIFFRVYLPLKLEKKTGRKVVISS
ncbi:hypothetical protein [Burkholderia orbicola]|uniref:hypothetical protein n=1 Tax=Burkholderia orbicola TaxID=2978683 RepID=UPI001902DD70|nr:hypothetical protein [Burkholderia orbicola]MBK1823918.1 hypothetical protein [Burkholderia orbicola]